MIAGWPGAFKSTFALNCLVRWAQDDNFVGLYVAADSDHHTVSKRCSAIISGDPMTTVEKSLRTGGYDKALKRLGNIHWEFRPLGVSELEERLVAVQKMHGKMPDLIVMDNLMNMVDNPTDYSGQMILCRDLDTVAKAASSHVMILHHTHEDKQGKTEPAYPQARWDIHGKVNQFPRLILTLAAQDNAGHTEAHLMIACVKNTLGKDDRTGREYTDYIIETASARVSEIPRR